jgi:hypothetical protein
VDTGFPQENATAQEEDRELSVSIEAESFLRLGTRGQCKRRRRRKAPSSLEPTMHRTTPAASVPRMRPPRGSETARLHGGVA